MGVACLAAALLIFYFTVAAFDYSQTSFFNLDPVPDATEYMAAAVALAESGEYGIQVAGEFHPPRYPPGYSLLMQPFLWLGASPVEVPFLTSRAFGLATILAVFAGLALLRNLYCAGLAALLVAAFPMFIILSRSPLSDISGGLFCLTAFFLLWAGVERRRESLLLIAAFLLGLSSIVRVSNLLLVMLLPAVRYLWGKAPGSRLSIYLLLAWAAGVMPLLAFQYYTFGNPLATGYSYWIPQFGQPWNSFAWQYVLPNLGYLVRETLQQEYLATPAWIFGLGSYFDLTFFLLLAGSLVTWKQGRVPIWLAFAGVLYGVILLFYFFQDARFFWPMFLVLFPVMACGLTAHFRPQTLRPIGWTGWLLLGLLFSHLVGYPNRWANPELIKYLRTDKLTGSSDRYELCKRLAEVRRPGEVAVFTDLEMPYVAVLAGRPRAVYPLIEAHSYRFNPAVFEMGPPQVRRALEQSLANGLEIWALVGNTPLSDLEQHLPLPEGYSWSRQLVLENDHGLARVDREPD